MKVLIADGVSQTAVDILKDDFECVIKDKLPAEELLEIIPDFDALIVRSASKVTAEVIEAAKLDDASELKIMFKVMMPMVKSALVTIGLLAFISNWNNYFWPLLVLALIILMWQQLLLRALWLLILQVAIPTQLLSTALL